VGAARWKGIQRWNYAGAILVVAHGLLYQAIEKRIPAFIITLLIIAAAIMILQLLGFRRRKEELKQSRSNGTVART
jgi:DMSO/TMAO reductase YedYZ heme-binding membrane subunit